MVPAIDHVVAVDVGGTTFKAAVVEPDGRAHSLTRRPTGAEAGPEAATQALLALADELTAAQAGTVALGLAVPGLVDEATGTVRAATNLGWRDLPLGSLARDRVGAMVTVTHDVRAGAVAEGLVGAARGARDYLLLTLGTGVGAAVVLGGRPYVGSRGRGGELGHVPVRPDGPMCGCGRRGCLESLASAGHVARRYAAMAQRDPAGVDAEEVCARARGGDPVAELVWREAIDALAVAIAGYATLLDPELIVIGGGMAQAGEDLFAPLRQRLAARVPPFAVAPPVVPAALGEDAGRYGAAIAAWRAAGLDDDELATWPIPG